MEHNNSSMLSALNQMLELSEILKEKVISLDRANIVLLCSHIQYCLSDILEQTVPCGYEIEVKPYKPLENGNN